MRSIVRFVACSVLLAGAFGLPACTSDNHAKPAALSGASGGPAADEDAKLTSQRVGKSGHVQHRPEK